MTKLIELHQMITYVLYKTYLVYSRLHSYVASVQDLIPIVYHYKSIDAFLRKLESGGKIVFKGTKTWSMCDCI